MNEETIKCHYCGSANVEKVAWRGDKIYSVKCLDGEFCKYTTVPQIEPCGLCGKEFEFRYDPGWFEHIICFPCQRKRMDEYFERPETQAMLKESLKTRSALLEKMPKDHAFVGGFALVPFNVNDVKDHKP